jgi:hypothetical protein
LKRIEALGKSRVKVGWFPSSVYENGLSVATVAETNEYGSPNKGIPPRPFMRPTIAQKKQVWKKTIQQYGDAVLSGKADPAKMMDSLGLMVQGDIARAISRVTAPALNPATVAARLRRTAAYQKAGKKGRIAQRAKAKSAPKAGITKPLVDTGYMLTSISYEVNK